MPKLALLVTASLFFYFFYYNKILAAFLKTLNRWGADHDLKPQSDLISTDIHEMQNSVKRYLVFGSGSFHDAYPQTKNLVYGVDADSGFFSVGIFNQSHASKLSASGYHVIEDFPLEFHSKYTTYIMQLQSILKLETLHSP